MAAPRLAVFSTRDGDLLNSFDTLTKQLHNDTRFNSDLPRRDNIITDVTNNYVGPLSNSTIQAGSKILVDRLHTHPDGYLRNADIALIAGLEQYLKNLALNDPGRGNVEKLLSYWYGANSLKRLDRFLDRRQPPLAALPAFTGMDMRGPPDNPGQSPEVFLEWQFRRLLIRCLHFPGLAQIDTNPNSLNHFSFDRAAHIVDLYVVSRLLLELEHVTIPEQNPVEFPHWRTDPHRLDLDWVKISRSIIDGALQQMFDTVKVPIGLVVAMAQAARDAQTPMPVDDISQANMSMAHLELMKKIQDQMDETMRQNPFERLLLDLLDKENTFERLLSVEHVDDKLINKQISLLDEENVVEGPHTVDQLDGLYEGNYESTISRILQDISFVNRQRRNFRLFKDWNPGHRPWRQMFQLYDSSQPGGEWLKEAIPQFLQRTELVPNANERMNPTDYFVLAPKLFDLKPYDVANEPESRVCQLCQLPFAGYPGPSKLPLPPDYPIQPVINSLYDANSPLAYTVTQLYCKHAYHTTCIFKWWDRANAYTHSCRICGHIAKLNWDLVALPPLEFDPPYDPDVPGSGASNIFAHNTFAHRRAELLFPKVPGSRPGRAGGFERRDDIYKDFVIAAMYNIPSHDKNRLVIDPTNPTNIYAIHDKIALEYWMKENMLAAEYSMNPIRWDALMFEQDQMATMPPLPAPIQAAYDRNDLEVKSPPYDRTKIRGMKFTAAELAGGDQALGRRGYRAIGRELGSRYMASVDNNADPLDPNYRSVYDMSERRELRQSRFLPQVEAAELRRRRRARNQRKRMAVRAEGQVLAGFPAIA
ncbi:hypothetical protein BDZ45DRAFT_802887 [Acephala macrosclerotiorum]|nr:hypothetical protein BDZ45DRAFT_802887 [Acephala macrosclerotiorum]